MMAFMRKLIAVIGFTLALVGCGPAQGAGTPSSAPSSVYAPPPSQVVTYEVTGTAETVDVTAQTPSGSAQESGATLPWTSAPLSANAFQGGFAYVSAQNKGEYGDVTCEIRVDDEVVATNTSTGAYTIATCQTSL